MYLRNKKIIIIINNLLFIWTLDKTITLFSEFLIPIIDSIPPIIRIFSELSFLAFIVLQYSRGLVDLHLFSDYRKISTILSFRNFLYLHVFSNVTYIIVLILQSSHTPNWWVCLRAIYNVSEGFNWLNPFSPHDALKHHFRSLKTDFPTTKGFRTKICMKLVYQCMAIFFNFHTTSSHLHPLQVENCDSNSRLVVDEDDNGKFRPERVKTHPTIMKIPHNQKFGRAWLILVP